jgi:4-amino-4-deoxy-L-arabinose transferase-like glycosyltransferase
MSRLIPVFFGALFTVATAWSLGMLLFRRLSLVFNAWEERLLAFVAGSACLSAIMFLLSATHLVRRGILLVLALAIIGYSTYSGALRPAGKYLPPLPRLWLGVFAVGFAAFTYVGFFNALAPEHSPDGMSYHLAEVLKYQHAHGFPRITTDVYSNLSQGIELVYLFAVDFGRYSAATLVHFTFLVVLVFLMLSYGKRIARPEVGVAGALFTYACPIVLLDASIAYIDVALAAVLFALFYLLQIWDESRDPKMLVPIGLLAGFGYEVKYTAFVAVPYALGFVAWKLWRERKPVLRPVLVVSLIAVSCIVPWMVKNWIEVANPVSPLANRIFPNPYVHISFEDNWRKYLSSYDLASRWQIPLQITVQGDHVEGFLGPLFLLAPLALLALRWRPGRQLLLAAAIFGCTYFSNIGTRFLIPVVPFVSLALALAAANIPWLLLPLVIAHGITCWPDIYDLYCARDAFRIRTVPVEAALRLQPEEAYLSQDPEYQLVRMINSAVPAREPVFAISQGGQSYLQRDLLVGYESASNEVLQDILWTPVVRAFQPARILKFDFAPRELRKVRVVQTASLPTNQWSIAEMRIFSGQNELMRDPAWRLTAHPNPWEVQLAFDNSPVTRWRSWQPAAPGMYIEVDFGRLRSASAVVVESSDDTGAAKVKLEGMGADGSWVTLSDNPVQSRLPIRASLRLAATSELKARGIHYLLIKPENPGADDLRRYPAFWGLTVAGSVGDVRLFHIK